MIYSKKSKHKENVYVEGDPDPENPMFNIKSVKNIYLNYFIILVLKKTSHITKCHSSNSNLVSYSFHKS